MLQKDRNRGRVAVQWVTEMFRLQREYPGIRFREMARVAGISHGALFSPEVAALPIKKIPVQAPDGSRSWIWSALPGWPSADDIPEESSRLGFTVDSVFRIVLDGQAIGPRLEDEDQVNTVLEWLRGLDDEEWDRVVTHKDFLR